MLQELLPYFENKKGIRIGGSLRWKFEKYTDFATQIVDVNNTPFFVGIPNKADYFTDATNLYFSQDGEFDFVCSSHVLEHIANPIKAIKEWMRVVKKGGVIYCAVPDKRFTFDHKRKRTTMQHLVSDYQSNIGPHDITHLQDIIFNVDLEMSDMTQKRMFNWLLDYAAVDSAAKSEPHHHVYTKEDLIQLFKLVGLEIVFVDLLGDTIHLVGRK